jgi:hypothetical protein
MAPSLSSSSRYLSLSLSHSLLCVHALCFLSK